MGRPLIQPDRDPKPEAPAARRPGVCVHCGLDIPPGVEEALGPFCCGGCRAVHAMIHDAGLERFYDLKPSRIAPAADLRPDNLAWLDVLLEERPDDGDLLRLSLDLQGVHCAACVWLLEELFRRHEGGRVLTVNPARGTAEVVWDAEAGGLKDYLVEAERYGYRFGPPRKGADGASRGLQVRMGVSIAAAMNVMMYSLAYYFGLTPVDGTAYVLFGRLIAALATVTLLVGGWPFLSAAWRGLRRGLVHLDLPIALGMVLGYCGSLYAYLVEGPEAAYFDTITIFVALMLVGRWLQEHVLERNRNQLLASGGVADLYARRLEDGRLRAVSAAEVAGGDELWIAPGDLVPVEGLLMQRDAEISLDWITGESRPERRAPGEKIPAGAFNAGREGFRLAAVEAFSDSRLHDLMRARPDGDERPAERGWWHRVGTVYVSAVLALAAFGFLTWVGRDVHKAVEVTVAILVVTCPCAVGLALPLGRELVHVALRRHGVLLRRDDLLDRALNLRKIVFDKTGTLTRGRLQIVEESRRDLLHLPADVRRILWNMCARSNHPVSRAVAAALSLQPAGGDDRALEFDPALDGVVEEAGWGLRLEAEGVEWRLGRPDFALDGAVDPTSAGATAFSRDGGLLAAVRIEEDLKADAADEVARLGAEGYEVHLLSGDAQPRVDEAAVRLGLPADRARGALTPEDKAALVADLDERDTLMVGDGINDSPSFDAAYAAATPAVDRALMPQKSDFYFLGDGVSAVRRTLSAARVLRRVQNANLTFAAAYNALAVGLCLSGSVTPVVAAVLMPLSSVTVVTITSLRLRPERSRRWTS